MEAGLLRKQRRYDIHEIEAGLCATTTVRYTCMNWRPNWYPSEPRHKPFARTFGGYWYIAEARKLSSFAVLISLKSHRVRLHTDTGAEIQYIQADLDIFAHPGAITPMGAKSTMGTITRTLTV